MINISFTIGNIIIMYHAEIKRTTAKNESVSVLDFSNEFHAKR